MMDATTLGFAIKSKEIKIEEAVRICAEAIEKIEPRINALITSMADDAFSTAKQLQMNMDDYDSPLFGVPFVVKDNICMKGKRTTCGSYMLAEYVPPYTATALEKVLDAGAVCIGKGNMDEFAMGATGETSHFGKTRNPLDISCVPGGSSSGPAAAVAAGECYFALGSDSGGSVRLPAAYCGLVGMIPTYGRVSRYGLVAHVSSMDQIGPITKNVTDCINVMNLICGHDSKDSTSVKGKEEVFHSEKPVRGMKIVVSELFMKCAGKAVQDAVYAAAKKLEGCGVHVEEVDLSFLAETPSIYSIIACAESSSNLARYDGIKYGGFQDLKGGIDSICKETRQRGFGDEVKRRIFFGSYVLSEGNEKYFLPAQRIRREISEKLDELFKGYDAILLPVSKTAAPKFVDGFSSAKEINATDIFTVTANLAHLPAITVPFGMENELPLGVQLLGKRFDENTLFALAAALEGN